MSEFIVNLKFNIIFVSFIVYSKAYVGMWNEGCCCREQLQVEEVVYLILRQVEEQPSFVTSLILKPDFWRYRGSKSTCICISFYWNLPIIFRDDITKERCNLIMISLEVIRPFVLF